MNILVLNSGSSSVKYQLFSMPEESVVCTGLIERIGEEDAGIRHKSSNFSLEKTIGINNHTEALEYLVDLLLDPNHGSITSKDDIKAIGHRVVHGGHNFTNTVEIDASVKAKVEQLFSLAPLHNPSNLEGIKVAEGVFTKAKQVAVFDTAFHQSIPEKAFKYAIPNTFYDDHQIRLYGFHGTSHKFVTEKARAYLKGKASNIISIHLGNGCSITAVKDGKSIDHSLGFAPGNGLIMGTRSGDIDHALVFYLCQTLNYTLDEVNTLLQKHSGMLGLTGYSDLRDIETAAANGDAKCKLALAMSVYRIKKYIGAYTAAMNGLDAVIFTAGIGENSQTIRKMVCSDMQFFGMHIDLDQNQLRTDDILEINSASSNVKILVIPTNEELEIAKQTYQLMS